MPIFIDSQARDAIMAPAKQTVGQKKFEGKNSISDKDVELKADE